MKNKILILSAAFLAAIHCTANSTVLGDTAASLQGTTTSAGNSDATLAKKLRSIWLVGGTRTAGLPAAAVAVGAMAATLDYYDPITNTWASIDSTAWTGTYSPRLGAAYAGYNGKIYVIGGYAEGASVAASLATTTTQIYDIATSTWSTGTALPAAIGSPAATQLDGKIYIWSGSSGANASVFTAGLLHSIYNIAGNSWSNATVPVAANAGTEMCMVHDGFNFLKVGGKTAAATVAAIASYIAIDKSTSPFTNTGLTMIATGMTVRTGASCLYIPATSGSNAKLMLIGGYSTVAANTTPLSALVTGTVTTSLVTSNLSQYATDPFTNAWNSTPNLPAALANGAAVLQGTTMYYMGGNSFNAAVAAMSAASASSAPVTSVYAADSSIGFWQAKIPNTTTSIPAMPTARWGHGAVLVQ